MCEQFRKLVHIYTKDLKYADGITYLPAYMTELL